MSEKYKELLKNIADQKEKKRLVNLAKQRKYRASKKGKEAVARQNAKAKLEAGYAEKMRKNAKDYDEWQIQQRILGGEEVKRRKKRPTKDMEERVISWNTEDVNTIKNGVYIAYRKLKLQKKKILFKNIKKEPYIEVGYIENNKRYWEGQKYIKKNPSIYNKGEIVNKVKQKIPSLTISFD